MKLKVLGLLILSLFSSCVWWGTQVATPITHFIPQILLRSAFETTIQLTPPQSVVKSGKIYVNGTLMIVNDVNRGFHIYNYSNPAQPVAVAFLQVPGATDIAIRGTTLYINQAVDLVTVTYNINNNTISAIHRNRNVFPQKVSPDGFQADVAHDEIVVNWIPN